MKKKKEASVMAELRKKMTSHGALFSVLGTKEEEERLGGKEKS